MTEYAELLFFTPCHETREKVKSPAQPAAV
jgi:hypothetical protein